MYYAICQKNAKEPTIFTSAPNAAYAMQILGTEEIRQVNEHDLEGHRVPSLLRGETFSSQGYSASNHPPKRPPLSKSQDTAVIGRKQ